MLSHVNLVLHCPLAGWEKDAAAAPQQRSPLRNGVSSAKVTGKDSVKVFAQKARAPFDRERGQMHSHR